ncbi:MAG: ribosome assembly factor SBDS [Candidatus Nanohaloarchaea archaeon]
MPQPGTQGAGDRGSGEEEGVDTSEAIKIRYSDGKTFEILVEPEPAKKAKFDDEDFDMPHMLFVQEVFTDADQGKRASPSELEQKFGTKQLMEAAEEIFEKGDMQLTTDQKAEMRKEKRKQIVDMIARRVQNPKTGNPHPPKRVENALEEAGFNVNWDSDVEEKFQDAIDAIRPIIPVSLEEKTVAIKIPVDKAGKAYDKIQNVADVKDEEWGEKSFIAKVELPAGVLSNLMEELQQITSGEAQMKEF